MCSSPSQQSEDEQLAASAKAAGNVIFPLTGTSVAQPTKSADTIEFETFIRPLKPLEENAKTSGHAILLPDEDGVVRRLPLVIHSGEDYKPALALATAAVYRQHTPDFTPPQRKYLSFGGQSLPVSDMNCMLINYVEKPADGGSSANPQVVSYVDVLKGNLTQPSSVADWYLSVLQPQGWEISFGRPWANG